MIELELRTATESPSEWDALAASSPDLNLIQSWAYGEAKAATSPWQVERWILADGGRTVGLVQVLVRRLPLLGAGVAWVNRGPMILVESSDRDAITVSAIAALRRHYAEQQGLYLRLAPAIQNDMRLADQWDSAGMAVTETPGWASAKLDLSVPADTLRSSLKAKWRGHLNKGEREIDEIRTGTTAALFDIFLVAHQRLLDEAGFSTTVDCDFLRALYDLTPEDRKPYVLIAGKDDQIVGSLLMVKYGHQCEYLAGNTTNDGRRLNAGQLLLWRAIVDMQDQGFRTFDMSGMDPEQTPPGIFKFKEGVNAEPYRLANEWEAGGGGLNALVRWRVSRARQTT